MTDVANRNVRRIEPKGSVASAALPRSVDTERRSVIPASIDRPTVTDTTEIRWFGNGTLPDDVVSWFTRTGHVGAVERRVDTYRLDGRTDIGVKLRSQSTLELKIRRSTIGFDARDPSVHGNLETWRRWSPADGLTRTEGYRWVDVQKVITKRRFEEDGVEDSAPAGPPDPMRVVTDVEMVALEIDGADLWSFSFAVSGPGRHLGALQACWTELSGTDPGPLLGLTTLRSCGYPEYLTRRFSPRSVADADSGV